jgi:predicted phage terminase large subunit-like protein
MSTATGQWKPARHLMRVNEVVTQAILAGRGGRVMVSMPPQNGKSTLVSELLPAWFLGRHPDKQVAMVSYEADFAATFGRKARDRLEQQGHLFGVSVDQSSRAANHWAIKGRRGAMFTSGVGGPLTGKSAHLLIIDDPIKNSEEAASETIRKKHQEWYRSTAYSRIQPDTVIVVVMTRWHEDDLCGWLLQEEATGGDKWEKLVFPAICESENDALGRKIGEPLWPERYSAAMLAQIRRTQGPYWWAGMYQQRPAPLEGGLFKREYFQLVDQAPLHHKVLARIRSWDFGGTTEGDYSVGVLMSLTDDGRYYVEHIIRGQWEPGVRDRIIRQVAETDGQDCMINLEQEPGSGGLSQVKYLRLKLGGYPVFVDKPTGDPLLRAKPLASSGESGIIHLVKGEWIRAYLDEMMVFPNGSHDDQVMASCYAFNRLASSGMYEIDTPHSFDRPKADPERYGIRMVRPENNPREHRR